MPGPSAIRELRYKAGSSITSAFTDLDQAAWAPGTATKLRITGFDASGLTYEAAEDATLQDRMYGAPNNIPTLQKGEIKFNTYLGSGSSDTDENPICTLMGAVIGDTESPTTNKTVDLDSSGVHTATRLYSSGVEAYCEPGMAVLVGVRGDGRGDGRVGVIEDTGSDYIDLKFGLPGAPSDGDAIVISHTAYLTDQSTQKFLDFAAIGYNEASDQLNVIGCQGTFTLSGLAPGELPQCEWIFMARDYREESSQGSVDQLEPTSAALGNRPPVNKGVGCFQFNDASGSTMKTFHISDLGIEPNVTYEPVPSPCGANGIATWQRVPGRPGASFNVTLDDSDSDVMPGLHDDFLNGTAKWLVAQFGHTAERCCAIEMQNFYLDAAPTRVDIGSLAGINVTGHADWGTNDVTTELRGSSFKVHWF